MSKFYEHFYYSDRKTKVTSVAEILNAADGTEWYRDTGEIYRKNGYKLLKKVQFTWSQDDLASLFISKEDDDVFACTLSPTDDAAYDFGKADKRLKSIFAVNFYGKASSAEYADVAEKYTSDGEYPVGAVLQIANSDDHQVELYQGGTLAGVISENPAYKLNCTIKGQYVVLTGQSPVICRGKVKKGQFLVAQVGGFVIGIDKNEMTLGQYLDKVGVALEDNKGDCVLCKM